MEVAGTVSRPGAAVFANGIAAAVAGGNLSAKGVNLSSGSNTIGALAEDGEDEAVEAVEMELLAAVDLEPFRLAVSFSSGFDESLKVAGRATATVPGPPRIPQFSATCITSSGGSAALN